MSGLYANGQCAQCKQPLEPTTDEPSYLVSTAAEMLCPQCRQQYLADLMMDALQRSALKLCMLQERRKNSKV